MHQVQFNLEYLTTHLSSEREPYDLVHSVPTPATPNSLSAIFKQFPSRLSPLTALKASKSTLVSYLNTLDLLANRDIVLTNINARVELSSLTKAKFFCCFFKVNL